MKLYFMRHGQSNYNLSGLCNDDPSRDVHLTPTGRTQAQRAAHQLCHTPLDCIIVSELPRTQETAEIVNQYHRLPIQIEPALNDIRSGFDSRPVAEYLRAIARDPLNTTPAGGESLRTHKKRVLDYLEHLLTQQCMHVLVVAHEETLRVVSCFFNNLTDEQMLALHFNNCEILQFEFPPEV